ncbi:DUF1178 family protein [Neopusillimonas aromaticivorans]|jgi:hypothetical protein|uniref:DUF1178 family protein n=1 Tax=Neopusillimonas aromaticivorans TaxID=2979868 RepID=UPI0025944820|nr:DUF1178 family protein [Neopusillimonas aromaticivorans]NLZ11997.1 DUF1178 family protein [Alcaligenaceae bacterium]WJJ93941.1 DUF1178 family protein [Neopusillimonas aromaticivorans]
MALKVFDLQCELGHVFEGWFSSDDNYESQLSRGLLSCPVCNSQNVAKKLTASRISRSRSRNLPVSEVQPSAVSASLPATGVSQDRQLAAPATEQLAQLQAQIMHKVREIVRNTENVGPRFAEEALRMHHGETTERAIRGTATPEERETLAEEGVTILPIPDYLDDDRMQ